MIKVPKLKASNEQLQSFDVLKSNNNSNNSSVYKSSTKNMFYSPSQSVATEKSLFEEVRRLSEDKNKFKGNLSGKSSPGRSIISRKESPHRSPLKQIYYNQVRNHSPRVQNRSPVGPQKAINYSKSFFKVVKDQLNTFGNNYF